MIEGSEQSAAGTGRDFKVFISYRRDDAAAAARLLHDRLAQRFGTPNVFLDVVALEPGTRWLQTIKDQGHSAGACLALIGPRWLSILTGRSEARFEDPGQDVVKLELELALSRGSGVEVIPVLVGGGTMPSAEALPRSLRPLSETHAVELRHTHWDQDVEVLIGALERLEGRAEEAAPAPADQAAPAPAPEAPPDPSPPAAAAATPKPAPPAPHPPPAHGMGPDERHHASVLQYMVDQGTVVPLLGSRVTGTLPDAEKIAADLAKSFGIEGLSLELPRVAQEVNISSGRPDLVRRLRQILATEAEPTPVHRFLARFPRHLEEMRLPPRFQMIVTTNYDRTLERAFDEENEPYDVAVYVAAGPDRGHFIHFPFDRDPEVISVPNRYGRFPIDDYGELERTMIVKIHGGVMEDSAGFGAKDNFVVTEDNYIDYLSSSPIETLVPVQILAKLTDSHCLFLGYSARDWNLRVFLKRIWKGEPLGSKSWAVARDPDVLEKDFWSHSQVDFFATPLDQYVEDLEQHMLARAAQAPSGG